MSASVFERSTCEYKNLSQHFIVKNEGNNAYDRQFSHIYTLRLKKMREYLKVAVKKKWGQDVPILQLFELQEADDSIEKRAIIGTLYKQQVLKPNIVKEISEEHKLEIQPARTQFSDDSDELVLEDEQQRITLLGNIDVQSLITGVVCAVLGRVGHEGKFEVQDYCFAQPKERVYKPIPGPERLIVLVSGLGLGGLKAAETALEVEILLEWIVGEACSEKDQESVASVARLILAGNTLQECSQDRMVNRKLHSVESETQQVLLKGMKSLDKFLVQLLESVDVDLMPGEFDPGNQMLPQQPMHRCLLPEAFGFPTMHSVSNPYQCEVGGRLLLGTSGQNINDMNSLCRQGDRLRLLQSCLEWGHLSPSCPDTLPCFPCCDNDPFIMEQCPDILFAGNQPKFQSKMVTAQGGQAVRLIAVPSFTQSRQCVVVNLHTLDCYPVSFGDVNAQQ